MLDMDMLNQIAGAVPTEGGNVIRDGKYTFLVRSMVGEKKFKGTFVITEFYVESAEATEKGIEPNAVGSTCSTAVNLTNPKAKGAGFGNVKKMVLALLGAKDVRASDGKTPIEVATFNTEFAQLIGKLMSPAQPVRGMAIRCETWRKPKEDGTIYVNPSFYRVEQTQETIAAKRAFLDSLDIPGAK